MKKYSLLSVLALTLVLVQCKKDKNPATIPVVPGVTDNSGNGYNSSDSTHTHSGHNDSTRTNPGNPGIPNNPGTPQTPMGGGDSTHTNPGYPENPPIVGDTTLTGSAPQDSLYVPTAPGYTTHITPGHHDSTAHKLGHTAPVLRRR
jgi:hypothetical protein